jgi:hypothetical protein
MKVRQYGKCQELLTFLQVQSQKPLSAMMKLSLMRTDTGMEDPEFPLLQRINSASEVTSLRNCSPKNFFTEFK